MKPSLLIGFIGFFIVAVAPIPATSNSAFAAVSHHDLSVELNPVLHSALIRDHISIDDWGDRELAFSIAPGANVHSVSIGGAAASYAFHSGKLTIWPGPSYSGKTVAVDISYQAIFNDQVESAPASFDNPGFGVEGTISEKGVFLLSEAGWYPRIEGLSSFKIKVIAPRGVYAATAGEFLGNTDEENRSVSSWKIDGLRHGLSLSAGKYSIRSGEEGKISVFTFFFPESNDLSATYINAASSHIAFYSSLHGPYAFPKFAVVENFFPTGYGFPSYTLLGSQILRLPFIPQTSLRHEIAHCWWGNGVLVDYNAGNWCEGLTTYVADYLSREISSPKEGQDYRRQILREFATLAASNGDFPLVRFAARTDPTTKAVGYGKAAFVFHMIRKRIGDDYFWNSLMRIYAQKFQIVTSWEDFRKLFVAEGKWDQDESNRFFDQWLQREGAPKLKLQNVSAKKSTTGWKVNGSLVQNAPYYDLDGIVALFSPSGERVDKNIKISGKSSQFSIDSPSEPQKLVFDPDTDLFRLLYPEEIPATVNSLKGSKDLVAVISASIPAKATADFEVLLAGMNKPHARIVSEKDLNLNQLRNKNVLFFGFPQSDKLRGRLSSAPPELRISADTFSLDDSISSKTSDCLFVVFTGPENNLTGMFLPRMGAGSDAVSAAARKITHYGQYSYVAFAEGTNTAKGIWIISKSPLVHEFKQ